tara:strand:- start:186 stop:482 length:297 start_codon:yes stop_codon:yes gene_type:complete
MYINIDANFVVSVADGDNLKEFSIKAAPNVDVGKVLDAMGEPAEEGHYWLSADSVIELSGRGSEPDWVANFWTMLEAVQKYGFSDIANRRVKAHVESE